MRSRVTQLQEVGAAGKPQACMHAALIAGKCKIGTCSGVQTEPVFHRFVVVIARKDT